MKATAFLRICALLLTICVLLGSCSLLSPENNAPIALDEVPEYSGKAYISINAGKPFFEESEISLEPREEYSALDGLGRCGAAVALIGLETMPSEDRESISSVTPSGWEYNGISNNNKYDFVENKYIYNRCHLIGHQLAGEDANEKNLVTGTRYLNIQGMLPFENQIAAYVKDTENHVLYRVTPIYDGAALVPSGILMEGYSVEDEGEGVYFCAYAYNVQPGVKINYFTGENCLSSEELPEREEPTLPDTPEGDNPESDTPSADTVTYVMSKSSDKYHLEDCSYAKKISEENRIVFTGEADEFKSEYPDHTPCGVCKPEGE